MKKVLKFVCTIFIIILIGCQNLNGIQDEIIIDNRVNTIADVIFSRFPFILDELWEKEFQIEFINKINPNDYYLEKDEISTEGFRTQIISVRSQLIKKYIEIILDGSFISEEEAFINLIEKYEQNKENKFLDLICEYYNTREYNDSDEYHNNRIIYYKQYFETLWKEKDFAKLLASQYEEYAECLLKSMFLNNVGHEERITWTYRIAKECPFNDSKIDLLIGQMNYIDQDYNKGLLTQENVWEYLTVISDYIYKSYYEEDTIDSYITLLYVAALKYGNEDIVNNYYDYLLNLYGEESFESLNSYYKD